MNRIEITSEFWIQYRDLVVEEVLPYQWEVMNNKDIEMTHEPGGNEQHLTHSYAVENLEIAAGKKVGSHHGYTFQDTDVYKWLEAAAYALKYQPNNDFLKLTDDLIDLIAEAQEDNGYLVTYFQISAPDRKFSRLKQSHELYTMGHFIEAGIAYYESTGNEKALTVAIKMADCINKNFGMSADKLQGADGHPEIELALARLYELTSETKYLELARFFIDVRGTNSFFDNQILSDGIDRDVIDGMNKFPKSYFQDHAPILEQESAEGHAVRMVYLCAGIAKVAKHTNDDKLLNVCKRFWNNIVSKKMYITGAIGSTNIGESFTGDYDLPNDTMYGETCASVGMAFFAREMLEIEANGEYGDVLEKELYNGIISGISLDGTHFFYVNPLQVDSNISKHNPSREHILPSRAEWFGCACCPSNLARLVASIDQYIYTIKNDVIYSHQFISNKAILHDGFSVEQASNFPWEGEITYNFTNNNTESQQFAVRIPSWSNSFSTVFNSQEISYKQSNGFIYIDVPVGKTTFILNLDMSVKVYKTNSNVVYNIGKVAIQRGPLVYCVEKIDQSDDIWKYNLTPNSKYSTKFESNLLNGIVTIEATAQLDTSENNTELYYEYIDETKLETTLTLVPYYSWANRGESQMAVWINLIN